jgi:hypothetical protein
VSDNRSATRHPVSIAAKLTVDGHSAEGTLMNLSLGGALMTSSMKHSMGQRVHVSFKVPTQEPAIEVDATVRWSDSQGVGLQFDGLRARDVWALNEYFKRLP